MTTVKLRFSSSLSQNDLAKSTVTIIGLPDNLGKLKYDEIKVKFGSKVSEEAFAEALKVVQTNKEPCPLYLNAATIIALPTKCSRTNTSSRAHAIAKSIKPSGVDQNILIVCDRKDVFASSLAVARAFPQYSRKSDAEKKEVTITVEFVLTEGSLDEEDCLMLENAAESVRLAARIVDAPCNEMNTDEFLNEIRQVGTQVGVEPLIIRDKELEEKGFGGIYGVGKAASHPPALAVLSYTPQGATKTVAWVGKGIVYDTGGLSIKGKTAMPGMKRDCGGAAGILGAFRLAVLSGFKQNLHAVFCLAENSVGPDATRPDDIHTLYSGKTVEINNTDAEGRLVLADGVFYAHNDLKADIILDMATLTGAQSIATGKYHAAVLTNTESWERASMKAGQSSGDLTFPIPYCPEFHFPEFNSAVADMKNSVADRSNALASCAGLFILAQLGFDYPGVWVHVDMAAPVHCGERATGYGVGLLVSLFGAFSGSRYLQSIAPSLADDADEAFNGNKRMRID